MGADGALVLSERFDGALAYASSVHRMHWRKGTAVPYASHLLGTCALTLEDGGSEEEAIAALLHDAVEDKGAHLLAEIRARFGDAVADIVAGCSEIRAAEGAPKPPWRQRKARYLAHLEDADEGVLRVSNADKVHNARAILADYRQVGPEVWGRFNPEARSADAQLWYLGSLSEVFIRRREGSFLATELQAAVEELRRLSAS